MGYAGPGFGAAGSGTGGSTAGGSGSCGLGGGLGFGLAGLLPTDVGVVSTLDVLGV